MSSSPDHFRPRADWGECRSTGSRELVAGIPDSAPVSQLNLPRPFLQLSPLPTVGVNGCIVDRRGGETSAFVRLGNLGRPSGATGAYSAAALEAGPCHGRGRLANQYVRAVAAESSHKWPVFGAAGPSCSCGHSHSSHLGDHAGAG